MAALYTKKYVNNRMVFENLKSACGYVELTLAKSFPAVTLFDCGVNLQNSNMMHENDSCDATTKTGARFISDATKISPHSQRTWTPTISA